MADIKKKILGQTPSATFHNLTKITSFDSKTIESSSKWPESWKKIYYSSYARTAEVALPVPIPLTASLNETLVSRESSRTFSAEELSLKELSSILYFSAGLKNLLTAQPNEKRFYPSAGGRYPLEIYPLLLHVGDLSQGVYHYHVKTNSLEILQQTPLVQKITPLFSQPWIMHASALIVVTAIFARTQDKYGDRGYRHILTEYGHMAQNIYLTSTSMNLACCSIGGFVEDGLRDLIDCDFEDESVVGVIAIGKNKRDDL